MAIDETTKRQLLLLAAALQFANELDRKMSAISAMLSFFGQSKKGDKTILETISTITQAPSARPPDVANAIFTYMVPANQWHNWETRGYFEQKLTQALKTGAIQNDTSLANIVTKQMMNNVKLMQRQEVFREANENVLEAAQILPEYSRKGYVIWRSRSQADGECRQYNGKVMTTEQFQSLNPVHPNCMCTAELVPETMTDEYVDRHRFKDNRPESERVPNTPERMREKGDRAQYERYNSVIGKGMPSFDEFKKIKYNGGSDYADLQAKYKEVKRFEKIKDKLLPNYDKATIAEAKLTKYALNLDHPIGKEKARVFKSALGYDLGNWEELNDQIIGNLDKFISNAGVEDQHGKRYSVLMDILGANGNTEKVQTSWIVKPDGTVSLTSVYVKPRKKGKQND